MKLVVSHDQQLAVLDGTVLLKAVAPYMSCGNCQLGYSKSGFCRRYSLCAATVLCGSSDRKDGRSIAWHKI